MRIVLCLLILGEAAWACEPCPPNLNLDWKGSAAKAGLVAVVESDGSATGKAHQGPATTKLKVIKVLKGTEPSGSITVHAWSGMCQYGLVLPKGTHLVFLTKQRDLYDALNQGCAAKSLPIKDGKVTVDGKSLTPEEALALK